MSEQREKAARGVLAVRGLVAEWQALRAELRAIEEAEHPAVTDKFGRVWTWTCHDCYHHDNTLALTRDMIDALAGLPPEKLRGNPTTGSCARPAVAGGPTPRPSPRAVCCVAGGTTCGMARLTPSGKGCTWLRTRPTWPAGTLTEALDSSQVIA